ncbi:MAG: hypothetical protein J6T36_02975 [Campylobacter sp.]|nr:hypothetical protein [Campylobacter sp.]
MAKFGFLSHSDMSKAKSRKLLCDEPCEVSPSMYRKAIPTGHPKFEKTNFINFAKFARNFKNINFGKNSYHFANLSLNLRVA